MISVLRHRTLGLGLAGALLLSGGLAACSSDSDSEGSSATTTTAKATTTTASDKPTTTTTSPGTLNTVSDVWAAPTAAGENAKVYLSVTTGVVDDQLVSVSVASDWAESAALVPATPIDLSATQTVALTDQGPYIELTGLKKALDLNKPFEITLKFANTPEQTVQGDVRDVDLGTT